MAGWTSVCTRSAGPLKQGPAELAIELDRFRLVRPRATGRAWRAARTRRQERSRWRLFSQLMTRFRATRRSQARNDPLYMSRLPAIDVPADGEKQFLHQVAGIDVLQAALPQQAINHWLVKGYELHPGLVILSNHRAAAAGWRGWMGRASYDVSYQYKQATTAKITRGAKNFRGLPSFITCVSLHSPLGLTQVLGG